MSLYIDVFASRSIPILICENEAWIVVITFLRIQ